MLTSLTLFAALSMTPGQGATMTLVNPRVTYGELGSPRPNNKLLPLDIFFLSFDIEGIKVSDNGRVKYSMGMEVTDAAGKSIYKNPPVENEDFMPLGGSKLPARAFVSIGVDQKPGKYTCKITVSDLAEKGKPVSKTLEQEYEVIPPAFGIVQVNTAADSKNEIAAPLVGVAGQNVWVHFAVVGFTRDLKSKQPDLSIEMVVYDKDKKSTILKPAVKQIPDKADGMVDEKAVGIPMRFLVPMNREGGFLIALTATDNISKKTSTVYLPLRVFPAGN